MTDVPAQSSRSSPPGQPARPLSLWDRFSLGAVHAAVSFLLILLSLRGLYHFGRAFGTLEWVVNYRRRRRVRRALEKVWDHRPGWSERWRIIRELFMITRCDRLFYLVFDRVPAGRAAGLFSISNRALLDSALARGRGVYVALSHHGAHHVAATLFAMCGYKIAGVRDRKESPLRRFIRQRLERKYPDFEGMRVIFADSYPREIYRCFQDGYVVGSAIDVSRVRDPRQKTEKAVIFGEERLFLSGPLRLALRCKAPVLQVFLVPGPGFRYRAEVVNMLLDPEEVKDKERAIREAIQRYASRVEDHVRRHPYLLSGI
jgi:lauroyl/myristoyl acyltransferase